MELTKEKAYDLLLAAKEAQKKVSEADEHFYSCSDALCNAGNALNEAKQAAAKAWQRLREECH